MKAWSVAVRTVCQRGDNLSASFILAETRTIATVQAVSEALSLHAQHGECGAGVAMTCPHEISPELLRAAVERIEGAP